MTDNKQTYSLALTALAELQPEIETHRSAPKPALPSLDRILAQIGPLPREALFLGMADDGLPVLLNMHDPSVGPILLVGDAGSGKTGFLKNIVRALAMTHDSTEVQFGVLTSQTHEWESERMSPQRVAIFSTHESGAEELLLSLASWAHQNRGGSQSVLLLIDDLEAVSTFDFDALQNLRWLLQRGPSRRVWPILTLNAERYGKVISWIPTFRTRVFGRIKSTQTAAALGGDSSSRLDQLQVGSQFSLRENGGWLRFWSPST